LVKTGRYWDSPIYWGYPGIKGLPFYNFLILHEIWAKNTIKATTIRITTIPTSTITGQIVGGFSSSTCMSLKSG